MDLIASQVSKLQITRLEEESQGRKKTGFMLFMMLTLDWFKKQDAKYQHTILTSYSGNNKTAIDDGTLLLNGTRFLRYFSDFCL